MKYKIVQKDYYNNYRNTPESKFYIKKRFLGLWFYHTNTDTPTIILRSIIFGILTLVPFMAIGQTLIVLNLLSETSLILSYMIPYFSILKFVNYATREEYTSVATAQIEVKNIIKKREFKNRTFDVVEITTTNNKLIIEKQNDKL